MVGDSATWRPEEPAYAVVHGVFLPMSFNALAVSSIAVYDDRLLLMPLLRRAHELRWDAYPSITVISRWWRPGVGLHIEARDAPWWTRTFQVAGGERKLEPMRVLGWIR